MAIYLPHGHHAAISPPLQIYPHSPKLKILIPKQNPNPNQASIKSLWQPISSLLLSSVVCVECLWQPSHHIPAHLPLSLLIFVVDFQNPHRLDPHGWWLQCQVHNKAHDGFMIVVMAFMTDPVACSCSLVSFAFCGLEEPKKIGGGGRMKTWKRRKKEKEKEPLVPSGMCLWVHLFLRKMRSRMYNEIPHSHSESFIEVRENAFWESTTK